MKINIQRCRRVPKAIPIILMLFSTLSLAQESKVELEKESVSDKQIKQHGMRFTKNVKAAVNYLKENPKLAPQYIDRESLKALQAALDDRTLDAYLDEQEKKFEEINKSSKFVLQPTIYSLADFGSTLNTGKNYQAVKASYLKLAKSVNKETHTKMLRLFARFTKIDKELYPFIWEILKPPSGGWTSLPVNDTSAMNCEIELGYSSTLNDGATACLPPGQATGTGQKNFNSNGLLGNKVIPLEPHLTCTKDQRRRGTCVGFAITANLETRASVKRDKKYNLSEQYNYFKSEIYTGNSRYSYGLSTQSTVNDWADDNWATGRETTWTYNRGLSMDGLETNSIFTYHDNIYPDSCDGYSSFCTDFAFQGEPNSSHTVFTRPSPQSSVDNLEARSASNITWGWFKSAENALMNEVVPLLNAKIPVVVSFGITEGYMDGNNGPGYITWSSSDPNRSGGHANLLVGYVSKNNLPAGAPMPQGNGYFISKNSWGKNRGDCGYDYLDEKWLRNKMTSLTTLTVNP